MCRSFWWGLSMNKMSMVRLFWGLLLVLGMGACKSAEVEGVYVLERKQMKEIAKEEVDALSKNPNQFAQFHRVMLGRMDVVLELGREGKASMTMMMPNPFIKGRVEKRIDRGTWRFSRGYMELRLAPEGKSQTSLSVCEWSKEKIVCSYDAAGKKAEMVFHRQSIKK